MEQSKNPPPGRPDDDEAAKQFARLLQWSGGSPLRPASSLVEQQRVLKRLRKQD